MNIPDKFWSSVMGALGLLTIFLVILSIKEIKTIGYVGVTPSQMNTITVSGKGEVMVSPDLATFSFQVIESAKTVVEAQSKATEKSNSALAAIREGGVADKDIKTTSYNINPKYDYPECTQWSCPTRNPTLVGYEVSQSVEIKVRDLDKAGAILATIGGIGVQNVSGLNFSVDDPDQVTAEARGLAIADAKAKANELAKQLGVSIVRVQSFNENAYRPYAVAFGMGGAEAKVMDQSAPAPELPAGENKIVSNVDIVYQVK